MSVNNQNGSPNPADSPLLWLGLFTFAALIALVLMSNKFEGRQTQLERQYEARQQAGQSISSEADRSTTQSGRLIITLKPLFTFFVFLLFALTAAFWIGRFRRRHQDSQQVSSQNGATP